MGKGGNWEELTKEEVGGGRRGRGRVREETGRN